MNTQNMWWTGKTYDLLDPALPAIFHDVQLCWSKTQSSRPNIPTTAT